LSISITNITSAWLTSAYVSILQHTSEACPYSSPISPPPDSRQHTSAYVSIRQKLVHIHHQYHLRLTTSAYVSIRQKLAHIHHQRQHMLISSVRTAKVTKCSTSAYVSIRLHTSAYTNLPCARRKRLPTRNYSTSAYVSIRQHTSAYVSIRQHTLTLSVRAAKVTNGKLFLHAAW
jgi:hypothetical protein